MQDYNHIEILSIISGISFLAYGLLCLFTPHMVQEFTRYGLIHFRRLVGFLEFSGGLGLILGIHYNLIQLLASLGLAVLMLMGVIVRLKLKDKPVLIAPAFVLMILNFYIFINSTT